MDTQEHVPVNPQRGEVPLPEAGEGFYLRFNIDTLERLEGKYGDDYIDIILKGLSKVNIKVYQTVISTAIRDPAAEGKGVTLKEDIPFGLSFEELQVRILDGLYMTIHGRTYEEQKIHEEEAMSEQMDKMKTDPRFATFLSSMPPGKQGIDQA